jgi:signal transduction histidine kinase/CheY-like chemotaxis protein
MVETRTKSLKETEKMLRASEARFKGMFDNMSSGVTVFEPVNDGDDFVIIDLNKASLSLDNLKRKDVLGRSVNEVFPHFNDVGLLESLVKVLDSGKPDRKLVTLSRDDKITNWRDYYIYRLPSKEIVAIFDDLTERKKAEEEQNILQEQLFASQKMETIGAFAGGIAHNFRNILQAISGNVEYIRLMYGEKNELLELTTSINDSIERGVDLINNLLHFSREGKETELVNLDLREIIQKNYGIIEKIYNKNIELKIELEENLFVKGDRSLLSQAFMNLFNNARDAMLEGGTLSIKAKKQNNRIKLTVSDTGHGMDKDTITKIFDPFFTLKDVGKGTGLGLSTTHGIIKRHKGKISVSSVVGRGTRFKISLPLVSDAEVSMHESDKEVISGNGEKILIVDDERDVLVVLADITSRLGYETIAIDKPAEAVESYKRFAPDVVLMDRSMPVMDGSTCIKNIVEMDPNAKIIIVSGYEESGPDGIDDDLESMIKGYINKPCKAQDLSQMLSKVLKE